jgi:hypothetical protein
VLKRVAALVTTAILTAPLLASCFGGGSGSDESFVRSLCKAQTELRQGVDAAIAGAATQTDPRRTVELLIPPVEAYVKAFRDAKPADDMKEWHSSASSQLQAAVDRFKSERTLASLEGFGDSPVPDPPAVQKQRLREAARNVEECNGVAFLKPD